MDENGTEFSGDPKTTVVTKTVATKKKKTTK